MEQKVIQVLIVSRIFFYQFDAKANMAVKLILCGNILFRTGISTPGANFTKQQVT